ncbi:Protein of unknown function [Gryllus bimaculatus]|nr:Protein of unknown function [Gryllus bimaculatus]
MMSYKYGTSVQKCNMHYKNSRQIEEETEEIAVTTGRGVEGSCRLLKSEFGLLVNPVGCAARGPSAATTATTASRPRRTTCPRWPPPPLRPSQPSPRRTPPFHEAPGD